MNSASETVTSASPSVDAGDDPVKQGMLDALKRAIRIKGSRNAMASALGIAGSAISQWERVPAERVLAVEAATDGTVTREELRPDLYPPRIAE